MNKIKIRECIEALIPKVLLAPFFAIVGLLYGLYKMPMGIEIKGLINQSCTKECFLLATGPSIKNFQVGNLIGQDCFTVSNFYLHEKILELNPIAHFLSAYHPPMSRDNFIKWIEQIDKSLPPRTILVTDLRNKILFEESDLGSKRLVIYVPTFPKYKVFNISEFGSQIRPASVPILALPVLMMLGYQKINLLGCDHNTLKNYKGGVENFYDNSRDPRVGATDKLSWSGYNIIRALRDNLLLFTQYQQLHNYATRQHIEIRNLSNSSWLDIF